MKRNEEFIKARKKLNISNKEIKNKLNKIIAEEVRKDDNDANATFARVEKRFEPIVDDIIKRANLN